MPQLSISFLGSGNDTAKTIIKYNTTDSKPLRNHPEIWSLNHWKQPKQKWFFVIFYVPSHGFKISASLAKSKQDLQQAKPTYPYEIYVIKLSSMCMWSWQCMIIEHKKLWKSRHVVCPLRKGDTWVIISLCLGSQSDGMLIIK